VRNWYSVPKDLKELSRKNGTNVVFGVLLDTAKHRLASIGPGPDESLAAKLFAFCLQVTHADKTPEQAFKSVFGTKKAKVKKGVKRGSSRKKST